MLSGDPDDVWFAISHSRIEWACYIFNSLKPRCLHSKQPTISCESIRWLRNYIVTEARAFFCSYNFTSCYESWTSPSFPVIPCSVWKLPLIAYETLMFCFSAFYLQHFYHFPQSVAVSNISVLIGYAETLKLVFNGYQWTYLVWETLTPVGTLLLFYFLLLHCSLQDNCFKM